MFCSNCGTEIADDQKFCHNCGKIISKNAVDIPLPPQRPIEPTKPADPVPTIEETDSQDMPVEETVVKTTAEEADKPQIIFPEEGEDVEVVVDDSDDDSEDEDEDDDGISITKIITWIAIIGGFILLKMFAKGAIKF